MGGGWARSTVSSHSWWGGSGGVAISPQCHPSPGGLQVSFTFYKVLRVSFTTFYKILK